MGNMHPPCENPSAQDVTAPVLRTPAPTLCGRPVTIERALVMAIINRTPDSFYDRGATFTDTAAMDAVRKAVDDGADLVDIGGVKAGPGDEVDEAAEIERVVPLIAWTREEFPDLLISVDTFRPAVARRARAVGADLAVNVGHERIRSAQEQLGMSEGFDVVLEMSGSPRAMRIASGTGSANTSGPAASRTFRMPSATREVAIEELAR